MEHNTFYKRIIIVDIDFIVNLFVTIYPVKSLNHFYYAL